MKTISVKIFACHGFGCHGGSYNSEETIRVDVSEEAGATIKAMLFRNNEVDQMVFRNAIKDGHEELKAVYDAINDKHSDMVARYWLFEAENEFLDEALEPYFWKDIENGLFAPEQTLQEYTEDRYDVDDEVFDEEEARNEYYDEFKDEYLDWVNGNEDYWFIAERTGLALDVVYDEKPELEFVVESVGE